MLWVYHLPCSIPSFDFESISCFDIIGEGCSQLGVAAWGCKVVLASAWFRLSSKEAHASSGHETSRISWWFGTFFIFPYIGNNHPNWLSYFSDGFKPPTSKPGLSWNIILIFFFIRCSTGMVPYLGMPTCIGPHQGHRDIYQHSGSIPEKWTSQAGKCRSPWMMPPNISDYIHISENH